MSNTPTQAELMRFVEKQLAVARSRAIERAAAIDPALAAEIEAIRADLRLAEELKSAAQSETDPDAERRIVGRLTASVTSRACVESREKKEGPT